MTDKLDLAKLKDAARAGWLGPQHGPAVLWLIERVERLEKALKPFMVFLEAYESVKMDNRGLRPGLDDVCYCMDGDMENGIRISDLRVARAALEGE